MREPSTEQSVVTPDLAGMRALAHPTRLRILGLLRTEGPATATMLADRLGLNTGQTSYHLRQLEKHGFVAEDTGRGDGRDRWWRAMHSSTRTRRAEMTTPEEHASLDAYTRAVAFFYAESTQAAIDEAAILPPTWRSASTFSDWQHRLTPATARAALERIQAILEELSDEDDPAAAPYVVQIQAFPRPGVLAQELDTEPDTGERP